MDLIGYWCVSATSLIAFCSTWMWLLKGSILNVLHIQSSEWYWRRRKHAWKPNAGFRLACRSPLCRVIIVCHFRVPALSGNAALALPPSGIAPELNRIQLSVICRGGQRSKVIDWLDAACRLVFPLRQVALAQLYKYHHQSSNAASGKLVWKQHN